MQNTTSTLYIVDDEEDIRLSLQWWFQKIGYHVKTFANSKELIQSYQLQIPNLILLDVNLIGEDGRDICHRLKSQLHFHAPVLLFSADPANGENYKQYEAAEFINKPFSLVQMSRIVASHLDTRN